MQIRRHCKVCGKEFIAIKTTQYFCCRKCFKKNYYLKNKILIEKAISNPKFPKKTCSFCGKESSLDFDPTKKTREYENWQCPICGVSNKMIWKYQDSPQSREIINRIVSNLRIEAVYIEKQYKVYQIPISHPEECDSNILTMSCEVIDILDIQRSKKKKIVFS